ncbi:valine--tRNA ligase [Acidocella sp. MX-AZ02]|uniref:valine--tRNA ligase n=1 Tax=Acidocella sp. MX-AZ02 TaxID=1214225 RepID=UPI00028C48A5|nr:valine--tRNA ligase [Acidocella sp. MX-AZ02]EKN01031.1 valyl-tRNA ligase [Acidocella sp. MX-AZ02]
MDKSFEPASCEARLYAGWEASGAFAAQPGRDAEPYTIMIPPPNVTGSLHVGHALTMTLQDILVRYRRMQGRDVLWQPGTDHAGIATQMVVERLLDKEGVSRKELGRETFLSRVWQWKAESGGNITRQLRRLGASPDWARERFTMDEGLSVAVREVFVRLFEEGLIYQDKRLVNWDTALQTAISDLEVESRDVKGHMWYIRYPVEGDEEIIVATTRPETMLADTAVAVHPENETYKHLIGKIVTLPLTGRKIPVVADEYADPEKGTGAVKITPAHDFNDFEVGKRHGLEMPSMLDKQGRITLAELGEMPDFVRSLEGLDRFAARKLIVAELEAQELLVEVKPHPHMVPYGDRSGTVIEPFLTTQWYCNAHVLAQPAIKAVEEGRINFVPKQWENTFFAWMRDIQPWCISRQLWWGHRIPAWYDEAGKVYVARTAEEAQAKAGGGVTLTQDEDVLDTWFSSALWPFSTLGWPEQTPELAKYYPTDTLVTGFDIIFFWVARMMMMGLHFMGDVPFRTIYIHGLVRDEKGQKMSKSKGNVLDPLTLIDEYGADALRYSVAAAAGQGRDVKLGAKIVETNRGFITKIWNAARFLEMNGVKPNPDFKPENAKLPLCRWILECAASACNAATAGLENFRPDDYAKVCYHFVWDEFCDWFVELAKPSFSTGDAEEVRNTAAYVLGVMLRLLHPLMPFVTEELWDHFGYGSSGALITARWPQEESVLHSGDRPVGPREIDWLKAIISEIRSVRSEINVPPSVKSEVLLQDASPKSLEWAETYFEAISRLARVSKIGPLDGPVPKNAAQAVLGEATIILPLEGLIDLEAEKKRLAAALAKAESELKKVQAKLGNADFTSRAPEAILEEHREREQSFGNEVTRLSAALSRLA